MPDQPLSVDGVITTSQPQAPKAKPAAAASPVRTWKMLLLGMGALLYLAFAMTCFLLMSMLPSPTGGNQGLVQVGLMVSLLGFIVFAAIGAFGFMRIGKSPAAPSIRTKALMKLGAVVLPGILLSAATPMVILRQPALTLEITSPTSADQFIAPVSVSFSLASVIDNLKLQGFVPLKYAWDINADGKVDMETQVPTLTAKFDKSGVFAVSVRAFGSDGTVKTASRRFVITQSVFTIEPAVPIINQPIVFSLSNLFTAKDQIQKIEWDFTGDGEADETSIEPQITHTFFRLETVTVTARVLLKNNTEALYQRSLQIQNPPALPFPVTLVSEPKNLLGNEPFSALFRIETETPVAQVEWTFGDGERGQGLRVAHTFTQRGNYVVGAKVYSESGSIAELSTVVQVVERLNLTGLTFDGTPQPSGSNITGEVPLTLNLTPKTTTPFVQFFWEAPEATEVGTTNTKLQATFRRPGTYTVTLVAQDAEKKVLRYPITVKVEEPSSSLNITMEPETGVAPLNVKFDASETYIPNEVITGFQWKFGDRSEEQYTGARTDHTYTEPGTYIIDLTVKTTSGKDFRTTKTIVVREPLIKACILPSRTSGPAPLGIQFSSTCSSGDIASYLWDFGDGAQSDQKDPIHVYSDPGTFTATLTVTDGTGAKDTVPVTITAQ